MIDWLLRFLKGALIGTGFILPGVSGGALAAVFGLYERIIAFIAHITRGFVRNVLFFIPVGAGALCGMFLVSRPLSYALAHYETQVLWGFAGCIAGTFPALWREAGKRGRRPRHYVILALTAALGFFALRAAETRFAASLPLTAPTWLLAGALIALGALVPGMSPSNFLVYLGLYTPMVNAFKTPDARVLAPLFTGCAACLFSLSSLIDLLIRRVYAGLFHVVTGIVIASTAMILPLGADYSALTALTSVPAFAAGAALGWWMSRLEARCKPDGQRVQD